MRHLKRENVGSKKHRNLIVVNFGDFGVVKKCVKRGGQQDSDFLLKLLKLYTICKNRNVVKTIGGSKFFIPKPGEAQQPLLAATCFCEENDKLLQNFEFRWGLSSLSRF